MSAHFYNIFTEREARRAVEALAALEQDRKAEIKERRARRLERLAREEFEREEEARRAQDLARARAIYDSLPWPTRLLIRIGRSIGFRYPHDPLPRELEVLE